MKVSEITKEQAVQLLIQDLQPTLQKVADVGLVIEELGSSTPATLENINKKLTQYILEDDNVLEMVFLSASADDTTTFNFEDFHHFFEMVALLEKGDCIPFWELEDFVARVDSRFADFEITLRDSLNFSRRDLNQKNWSTHIFSAICLAFYWCLE